MSTSEPERPAEPGATGEPITYEELLAFAREPLEESMYKASGDRPGRIRDEDKEQVGQGWHRAAKGWCQELRLLLDARRDAERVEQRLERLEHVAGLRDF